jgi:hypothetical protein
MPDDRQPSRPSLELLQEWFFSEWNADRAKGITARATHDLLQKHLGKDEEFQSEALQRLSRLEKDAERDAEDRAFTNGTGRHIIPPPPSLPTSRKSKPPWFLQDPFKKALGYILLALAFWGIGWASRHFSLPQPPAPVIEHKP